MMPSCTTDEQRTSVRGLGEIALRVNNLDAMQKFYAEVIGLPLMTRFPNSAFFKIAEGFGGHTQVLALFDRLESPGYRKTDAAASTMTTSHSRYLWLISQTKRRDWKHWGSKSKPPNTHGCIGARFM